MAQVTFFVRSNNDKAKTHMLYARVRINQRTGELSTEEKINPTEWDQAQQYFTGKTKEQTEYINMLCDRIKYRIKKTALLLENENKILTPTEVIKSYRDGNFFEKPTLLYEVMQRYITWEETETDLNTKTIDIHKRYLRHLKCFSGRTQIYVSDFNEVTAERFKDWFKKDRDTKNKTTASRHISYYRNALQWAVKKGIIKSHNLLYYEGERDPIKKPNPINETELLNLIQFQFKSPMLNNIKDLFLYSTATGISYGDLWSDFKITDTTAGRMIEGKRNKGVGNSFFVPYDEMAEAILQKHNFKLPKYCNGTYNRLLKEVAALVGIHKKITTHTARKTFGTLKVAQGWTLTSVKLMLGHSSEKTTELHYVLPTKETVVNEWNLRNQQGR